MGSFSIPCAISGLPISYEKDLVGFELVVDRYNKNKYVPASFPVFGKYDTYGRIKDSNLDFENAAIIHLDIWNNAELYFHKENRQDPFSLYKLLPEVLKDAKKEFNSPYLDKGWTYKDYLYYHLDKQLHKTDYGIYLKGFSFHARAITHKENFSFLDRSKLMEIILDKIENETYSPEDDKILIKIISLFSGQMLLGRNIMPSGTTDIEQCPEYGQRIKLMNLHLKLARKLKKEQNSYKD